MECILWEGWLSSNGYGLADRGGNKRQLAHRWTYEQAHGPIPAGMVVMHTCDTKACVNLDHLVLGTQADNMADMVAKGRSHQTRKTHCPQGHEYTEANTYRSGRGTERQCRRCRQEKSRARK